MFSFMGSTFKTLFSMAEEFFLGVRPVHFHNLIFAVIGPSYAGPHNSSFEINLGKKILKLFLRHLFIQGVHKRMVRFTY
jgi:hypothetical protein